MNDFCLPLAFGLFTMEKSITSSDDVQLKESFEAVLKYFFARQYIEDYKYEITLIRVY